LQLNLNRQRATAVYMSTPVLASAAASLWLEAKSAILNCLIIYFCP